MSQLKKKIKDTLLSGDFEKVAQAVVEDKKVFGILISLSYDKEELLCWRAIEAMGQAAGAVAKEDPAAVRNIVRRLLWSLSDESGGIAWSAPEMLGEIVVNTSPLCSDITPILLSLGEEEFFLKGVLWAVGRIVRSGADDVEGFPDLILQSLRHPDPSVRGLALYASKDIIGRNAMAGNKVKEMENDRERFRIYRDHELSEITVGMAAKEALEC